MISIHNTQFLFVSQRLSILFVSFLYGFWKKKTRKIDAQSKLAVRFVVANKVTRIINCSGRQA